jgi:dihydroxy-acid dehydratase
MSGTASGTIVLHVTPEAALGGPLALVQSGDRIALSVSRRELNLLVSDEVLRQRAAQRPTSATPAPSRGYRQLFLQHVTQADQGCDFDFLRATAIKGKVPMR